MRTVLALLLALPLALAACGGAPSEAQGPPQMAGSAPPPAGGACDLPSGSTSVRVAVLPTEERAQLQAQLGDGPVAVRMEGCRLVPIKSCYGRARASYTATPAETTLTLDGEADVLRDVPAASERLAPIVRAGHAVEVSLIGAGRFDYEGKTLERHFDDDACKDATHVVAGYWVGALAIEERGGQAIERSGDRNGCARAASSPSAPPAGCSDLLTLDLVPLAALATAPPAQPAPPPPRIEKPSGMTGDQSRPRGAIIGSGGEGEGATEGHDGSMLEERTGSAPGAGKSGCDPNDPLCVFARSRSSAP